MVKIDEVRRRDKVGKSR